MSPSTSSRKPLALALLSGALGAALALVSAGRTWGEGVAAAAVGGGELPLSVSGRDVSGVPTALAVTGLAALVAVFAVRRVGRGIVAALLTLSGAGVLVSAVLGAGDSASLEDKAAEATGLSSAVVENVTHSGWPWVAAFGGALLLFAGVLALRFAQNWPAMSGRYERNGVPRARRAAPVGDPDRPEELWKALDRGEDPTH